MLLHHSPTSPFVRKVMLVLHETGLAQRVPIASVDGWSEPGHLTADNPLSMVPTLVLDDGSALYDSPVICEYLDRLHDGPRMIPDEHDARFRVLREQALADGLIDSAILVMMETIKRPPELQWEWWLDLKRRAILRALGYFESQVDERPGRVDLGTLSLAAALGYLDLRGGVGEWRDAHPALAAWFADFSERPSMRATEPPA